MDPSKPRQPLGPMTAWRKLYSGSTTRRSRLHDELGAMIAPRRLLRNGPKAFATGLIRLAFGIRSPRPWISYDVQSLIARFLTKQSRVLEFGSGMSTPWYAAHAGAVCSIESDKTWFDIVKGRLASTRNVTYIHAPDRDAFTRLVPQQPYDFIMVDGIFREACVEFAIGHLAPGGVIYLDNSDKDASPITGDVPLARQMLLDFAAQNGLPAIEFTDFAPTQLHVQRGLWIGPIPD